MLPCCPEQVPMGKYPWALIAQVSKFEGGLQTTRLNGSTIPTRFHRMQSLLPRSSHSCDCSDALWVTGHQASKVRTHPSVASFAAFFPCSMKFAYYWMLWKLTANDASQISAADLHLDSLHLDSLHLDLAWWNPEKPQNLKFWGGACTVMGTCSRQ